MGERKSTNTNCTYIFWIIDHYQSMNSLIQYWKKNVDLLESQKIQTHWDVSNIGRSCKSTTNGDRTTAYWNQKYQKKSCNRSSGSRKYHCLIRESNYGPNQLTHNTTHETYHSSRLSWHNEAGKIGETTIRRFYWTYSYLWWDVILWSAKK